MKVFVGRMDIILFNNVKYYDFIVNVINYVVSKKTS